MKKIVLVIIGLDPCIDLVEIFAQARRYIGML